jgi:hypothetical protein
MNSNQNENIQGSRVPLAKIPTLPPKPQQPPKPNEKQQP